MAKEVILNIIREVSKFDFVDYPNKKRAPKDAKFKIVFYKPPPKTKTNIPKKFQGVQYFKNKNDAKIALKKREELTITLKEKKKKDMLGNNRNPQIGNLGIRFGENHKITIEQNNKYNKKLQQVSGLLVRAVISSCVVIRANPIAVINYAVYLHGSTLRSGSKSWG